MNLVDAQRLAEDNINQWLDESWTFSWNNRKRAFGVCVYSKKEIQLSRILTKQVDEEQVLDTILHEIAHALTPGAGHGARWKAMARRVGATPKATCNAKVDVDPKWVLVDTTSGNIIERLHRKPNESKMRRIKDYWVRGRKEETKGKLKYVPYENYIRAIDDAVKNLKKAA